MSARRLLPWFAATVAVLATAGTGLQAQDPSAASVRGVVYDSISHAPLPDAAVFLWETPHRAVSDQDGRFSIESVPPGSYSVLFFHTLLGELGTSVGPTRVELAAGETVDLELATPSMFTLVASECLLESHPPATGTVAGFVGDAETGTGMPGAHVTLRWTPHDADAPQRMQLRTDRNGWYRTCEAPSDVPITVSASFLSRQGHRRELAVPENGSVEAGFLLYDLRPAQLHGRLLDGTTDGPVDNAEIWLRGTEHRTLTRADGTFDFPRVPPGSYTLLSDHLRYGTKRDTLTIPSGETLNVVMHVDERPIEVASITVEVESRPITERAMGGTTITRADIEQVRSRVRDVADIVQTQNLPGVLVKRRSDGSLCVGYMPGQVRMMWSSTCVPMIIFINNVRANSDMLALQIPPEAIERITVYRPIEAGNLFGLGAGNGVMTIFTRRR